MERTITLTQGYEALVDDQDFDRLSAHKWQAHVVRLGHKERVYAARKERSTGKRILMHREILKAKPKEWVDHIDGNGLDNRRSNIRICTQRENLRSRRKNGGNTTSIYKGVHWNRHSQMWHARAGGKHIGCFSSECEAALAYDEYVQEHWGDYALKNFAELTDYNSIQPG